VGGSEEVPSEVLRHDGKKGSSEGRRYKTVALVTSLSLFLVPLSIIGDHGFGPTVRCRLQAPLVWAPTWGRSLGRTPHAFLPRWVAPARRQTTVRHTEPFRGGSAKWRRKGAQSDRLGPHDFQRMHAIGSCDMARLAVETLPALNPGGTMLQDVSTRYRVDSTLG
jgi:hypothetical protein